MIVLVTMSSKVEACHQLRNHEQLLQGVFKANQQLSATHNLQATLPEVLALLGEASAADRVYLCNHHPHPHQPGLAFSLQMQWPGVPPNGHSQEWQNVPYTTQGLRRWQEAFLIRDSIKGTLATFPSDEQAFLQSRSRSRPSPQAVLLLPVWGEQQLRGWLGFEYFRDDGLGEDTELTLLQMAADSLGGAIARQQTLKSVRDNLYEVQTQLCRANLLFQAQQAAILEAMLIIDDAGNVQSFNQTFTELWSVPLSLSAKKSANAWLNHIAGQLREPENFLAQIHYYIAQKQPLEPQEITLQDGRIFHYFIAHIRPQRGETIGYILGFIDITSHKQKEQSLQENYALLEGVINSTHDLIFVKDMQGKYLLVNDAMAEALNVKQGDLLGKVDAQLYSPEIAHAIQQRDQQLLHSGKAQLFEQPLAIQGKPRTFWVSKTPYRDAQQTIIGLVGISRDVTEIQQVREENNRFFRLSSDMICAIGFNGYLQRLNPSFTRLLGYSREELQAMPLIAFIHPSDQATFLQGLARVRAGDPFQSFESRWRCKNGDYCWFSWSVTLYQKGQVFYATARDITDRRQAEMALQESEQRFRDVAAAAGEYVWETTADGTYTFLTEKVFAVKRHRASELLGKSLFSVLPPADAALMRSALQTASARKNSFRLEHRTLTPEGHLIWEEVSGLPILNGKGHIIGFRGTGLNITAKKQSEASLRLFKQAVDSASDAVCITDADFEYVYHNPAFADLFDLRDTPELAAKFINRADVYAHPQVAETVTESILQGRSYAGEVIMRTHSDHLIPVMLRAHAIYDEADNIIGTVRSYANISERKAAEAQLKLQAQFLQSIYEGSAHRIFALNVLEDGKVVYSGHNRAAEDVTGWASHSIVGQTPADLFGEIVGHAIEAACRRCIETTHSITLEEHLTLNGQRSWVLTTFNPLQDETGNVHRIIGTAFDITPIKQAEAELKQQAQELQITLKELQKAQSHLIQSEKMSSLGQLVAGVAHEINNPVNFIYGNLSHARQYTADLLTLIRHYRKCYPAPEPVIQALVDAMDLEFVIDDLPKLLSSMKVGAERIQAIVSSLRIFSHMDEAEMKAVNLHDGLDSTLMILQNRLKAKPNMPEIEVVRDYGDLPQVECWAGQLNQVFMNILSNAIDALEDANAKEALSHPSPQITIKTGLTAYGQVTIAIQDNGPGIPEDICDRLFDPFFTTKPIGKGTGMGLAISYQIVTEKHHGRLICDSQVGIGTAFVILIPLKQPR